MLARDRWILPASGIAAATFACAVLVRAATGYQGLPRGSTSLEAAIMIVTFSAIIRLIVHIVRMWRAGVDRPAQRLLQSAGAGIRWQLHIVLGVAIVGVFLYSITGLKSMIVAVIPFWADAPLEAFDRGIGIHHAAIASAISPALPAIGLYYGLWHAVNLGGIIWVIHWRDPAKGRFILGYMLTWAIGMAAAYLFSSAGPLFTGSYPMALAPDSVRVAASYLWSNYRMGGALIGGGISAFPSLHVAIATWFGLVLANRGWPRTGIAYALSIWICSVLLGWHYMLDGLAGIVVALGADRLACFRRPVFMQSPRAEPA